MSVADVIGYGLKGIASLREINEMLPIFEGQAVSFSIMGGEVITFVYRGGRLILEKGQSPGVKGAAEVSLVDFISFINGKREFPGLFTHEFPHYFKPTVGEYFDFGGDFMMMGPVFDGLSRIYRSDPAFQRSIDSLDSN